MKLALMALARTDAISVAVRITVFMLISIVGIVPGFPGLFIEPGNRF